MTRLADLAKVVRSKNAGPTLVTIDVLFADARGLERALAAFDAAAIARLYGLSPHEIRVIPYLPALAIKVVMRRRLVAGEPGDRDVYGAQQHAPLLGLEI
jgi:hypothetical protein